MLPLEGVVRYNGVHILGLSWDTGSVGTCWSEVCAVALMDPYTLE